MNHQTYRHISALAILLTFVVGLCSCTEQNDASGESWNVDGEPTTATTSPDARSASVKNASAALMSGALGEWLLIRIDLESPKRCVIVEMSAELSGRSGGPVYDDIQINDPDWRMVEIRQATDSSCAETDEADEGVEVTSARGSIQLQGGRPYLESASLRIRVPSEDNSDGQDSYRIELEERDVFAM